MATTASASGHNVNVQRAKDKRYDRPDSVVQLRTASRYVRTPSRLSGATWALTADQLPLEHMFQRCPPAPESWAPPVLDGDSPA
jgi:hypothetical protein